ncbi:hypothetical protein F2P56_025613 [Juglans regia]|uniref:Uncharacterized protein n=1 Tax=Juglans regia TaxID=51240 RepID=A0A833UFC0_JUGRE|nr:hypothetical protein F2P56_025613 [Juglans regia]
MMRISIRMIEGKALFLVSFPLPRVCAFEDARQHVYVPSKLSLFCFRGLTVLPQVLLSLLATVFYGMGGRSGEGSEWQRPASCSSLPLSSADQLLCGLSFVKNRTN